MQVRVVPEAFDPQAELMEFTAGRKDMGALAQFTGYCRAASNDVAVNELRIDHYPGYSEREIERLATQTASRFECPDLLIIHRVGCIRPGEAIVLVAALSAHRSNAFDVVRVLMDYLKTDAPFWKKESGPHGTHWVEPRAEDYARRTQAGENAYE